MVHWWTCSNFQGTRLCHWIPEFQHFLFLNSNLPKRIDCPVHNIAFKGVLTTFSPNLRRPLWISVTASCTNCQQFAYVMTVPQLAPSLQIYIPQSTRVQRHVRWTLTWCTSHRLYRPPIILLNKVQRFRAFTKYSLLLHRDLEYHGY